MANLDFFSLYKNIIAIPSISSTDPKWDQSNEAVIRLLADWFTRLGFQCEVTALPDLPGKFNLVATIGQGEGGLLLAGLSLLCRASHWLLYYPVLVSLLLLLLFARSLWQPQTLIERLARLQDPQLPPEAIRYTRRVTQVWCGFFVVNGTLALGTILLGDMALWSLYNGLLSYLLMGTLMGGEWLLRRRLQARLATSMLEAQP